MPLSLVLASSSPQRRLLLQGLGMEFIVDPSNVDEDACTERDAAKRAAHLARLKAQDVMGRHPGACIIGCDTLVQAPSGEILEKPMDAADARRMLRLQSGGISLVHSGLCVIDAAGQAYEGLSSSSVHFAPLSDEDIDWWIDTKEWEGRSGAFQIDGRGQLMIERIEGDWTSVVGLPVFLLGRLLGKAGDEM
jgi:septum formation protein